jgi:hypothetical protein
MGGMCVGSLMAPRLISRNHHPLKLYAMIEVGIGIIGLIILFAMPLVGGIYTSWAGQGLTSMLLRGIVAAICLLPPTFLMGATLPVISRWVKTRRKASPGWVLLRRKHRWRRGGQSAGGLLSDASL